MTHQFNGQVSHKPGPLEAAARAEARLIEQLHATAERLDRLATSELDAAKERLARSAARLADRVDAAREFAQATVGRLANLMTAMGDLFSDDVTRCDEMTAPRPLTQEEQQAIAEAPWGQQATAQQGPPDDEDDPEDDLDEGDTDAADPYADVASVGPSEPSRAKHIHELDPYSNGAMEDDSSAIPRINKEGRDLGHAVLAEELRDTRKEPQPPPVPPPARKKTRRGGGSREA